MEPDNLTLHVIGDSLTFFHKDLPRLIDSVTAEDKEEIESYSREIGRRHGHEVKLTWGYDMGDRRIENILSHICPAPRQCLDLTDGGKIGKGYLRYQEHNMGGDRIRTPAFSVALKYVAILAGHAVRNI